MTRILVGDIGGTKTTLACIPPREEPCHWEAVRTFASGDFPSLESIVELYLAETALKIGRAVFGIAGPVRDGTVKTTNLPWFLEAKRLEELFGFSSVSLLNDLEAMASGIPHLNQSKLQVINQGETQKGGTIAVIAPGTGLGEAFLVWDGSRYRTYPSAGGHVDFAPRTRLEWELKEYLNGRFAHVSYERVCSGPGISRIYEYLRENGYGDEPPWLAARLKNAGDTTPIITSAALDDTRACKLCMKTLDVFISVLGSETGNLALKTLAMGGVYLGGGIAPRILPLLTKGIFLNSFREKGRYTDLMDRIPVSVILDPHVSLLGAAYTALDR